MMIAVGFAFLLLILPGGNSLPATGGTLPATGGTLPAEGDLSVKTITITKDGPVKLQVLGEQTSATRYRLETPEKTAVRGVCSWDFSQDVEEPDDKRDPCEKHFIRWQMGKEFKICFASGRAALGTMEDNHFDLDIYVEKTMGAVRCTFHAHEL